jgi:hypothetical protein
MKLNYTEMGTEVCSRSRKNSKSVFDNLLRLLEDGIDETQTNESVPHSVSTNILEDLWLILKRLITTLCKLGYTINQNVLSVPQTVSNIASQYVSP